MFGLEQYSNILGSPNEGFHSSRIFGLAANDLIATLVLTFIIVFIFSTINLTNIVLGFFGLWFLGFCLHLLFGVQTPLTSSLLS